jgi:hypothetical protein
MITLDFSEFLNDFSDFLTEFSLNHQLNLEIKKKNGVPTRASRRALPGRTLSGAAGAARRALSGAPRGTIPRAKKKGKTQNDP